MISYVITETLCAWQLFCYFITAVCIAQAPDISAAEHKQTSSGVTDCRAGEEEHVKYQTRCRTNPDDVSRSAQIEVPTKDQAGRFPVCAYFIARLLEWIPTCSYRMGSFEPHLGPRSANLCLPVLQSA